MTLDSEFRTLGESFGLCSPSLPASRTRIIYGNSMAGGALNFLTKNLSLLKDSLLNRDGFSKRFEDIFSQGCKISNSL